MPLHSFRNFTPLVPAHKLVELTFVGTHLCPALLLSCEPLEGRSYLLHYFCVPSTHAVLAGKYAVSRMLKCRMNG